MRITIDGFPESRFTPDGRYVIVFTAQDLKGLRFEQWEKSGERAKLSVYQRDTGEYEGTAEKLTELPENATITVTGQVDLWEYTSRLDGAKVVVNKFTIESWEWDGWPWKNR